MIETDRHDDNYYNRKTSWQQVMWKIQSGSVSERNKTTHHREGCFLTVKYFKVKLKE